MAEEKTKVEGKKEVKGKGLAVLIFFVVVVTIAFIIGAISKSCKTETISPKQEKIDPVAQMQKKLGPTWTKIEMVQGKWYGPYKIKNGTKWRIATGSIIFRIDGNNNDTHCDFPGRRGIVDHGKKVDFSSTKKRTVMFFRY
ncbi:MAG: hypothetical protein H8E00_00440 [Deltaproteobacteria bacterium]|nr:hypothetical protein [Deltaproteobacteria bacterium]